MNEPGRVSMCWPGHYLVNKPMVTAHLRLSRAEAVVDNCASEIDPIS
jgi:hypothetical protein